MRDGEKVREERDTDGDGRIDVVTIFEDGVPVVASSGTRTGDGSFDSTLEFAGGSQERQERDTERRRASRRVRLASTTSSGRCARSSTRTATASPIS